MDSKYKGTPVITSKNIITIMFMIPSNKQMSSTKYSNHLNGNGLPCSYLKVFIKMVTMTRPNKY